MQQASQKSGDQDNSQVDTTRENTQDVPTQLPSDWLKAQKNRRASPKKEVQNVVPLLRPIRVIGNGAFGFVFEAFDQNRDIKVAVKRTQKAGNIVSREYEVMTLLKGASNVVQLIDFFYSLDQKNRLIQNIVMEFCEGSLEDQLRQAEKNKRPIPMAFVRHFGQQIFTGLSHMHAKKISHRDLKPENILIKHAASFGTPVDMLKSELKIADLGAAKVLDPSALNTPYVVSRYYRAPELILGSNQYDCSIDIWSTGCILFELVTRTPLFPGDAEGLQVLEHAQILGMPTSQEMEELQKICEAPVLQLLKRNQTRNGPVNLVELMMSNSRSRYSRDDIEQIADLIEQCLKWVPSHRITAAQALKHRFFS